jgi:hypothetical protein
MGNGHWTTKTAYNIDRTVRCRTCAACMTKTTQKELALDAGVFPMYLPVKSPAHGVQVWWAAWGGMPYAVKGQSEHLCFPKKKPTACAEACTLSGTCKVPATR